MFSGNLVANLNEDGDSVVGQLSVSDVDSDNTFNLENGTGTYGQLTLNEQGEWTYVLTDEGKINLQALKLGESKTDSFVVKAADGTTETITITLEGVNDPATFTGDLAANLSEDGDSATGTLSVSDVDGDNTFTLGNGTKTEIATYGQLTLNTNGHWTYVLTAEGKPTCKPYLLDNLKPTPSPSK